MGNSFSIRIACLKGISLIKSGSKVKNGIVYLRPFLGFYFSGPMYIEVVLTSMPAWHP